MGTTNVHHLSVKLGCFRADTRSHYARVLAPGGNPRCGVGASKIDYTILEKMRDFGQLANL